jgi:hypothetical protein
MASSRAFLSSTRLELFTLTTSRSLEGVGVMGKIERGGGVAVESDVDSAAGAGPLPLAPFFPRAMFDMDLSGGEREEEKRGRERREEKEA